MNTNDLHLSWMPLVNAEKEKDYFVNLQRFLKSEREKGKIIYPPEEEIFSALKLTPFDDVKVIILGQDPYHGPGQAHGLSFSVKRGVKTPPSLKNIYKEIERDLGFLAPSHGNLESWSREGVLLLNSVMTVEAGKAGAHQKKGWEQFTDRIISALSNERKSLVFLLWGRYAISKKDLIDADKHLILTSVHPSPLSAHKGFIGNSHFSETNNHLKANGITPINWEIKDEQTSLF